MDAVGRYLKTYGKLIAYVVLIVLQVVAAGFAAGGNDKGSLVIVATLLVTIATTVRELIREMTSPHSKAGREVTKAHRLLDFLTARFPSLTFDLTDAIVCTQPEERAHRRTALDHLVLTEAASLVPDAKVRAALFWRENGTLRVDAHRHGWPSLPAPPALESPEGHLLVATLDSDPPARKVWVEDRNTERSLRALAFAFSDSCQSLVACPVICSSGVVGFLHLESDQKVFDERTAAVVTALTQLLGAARSQQDGLQAPASGGDHAG